MKKAEKKNLKRVFIIHGWAGYPEECWFLWLKKELEKRDIKAEVPSMPNAEAPKIDVQVGGVLAVAGFYTLTDNAFEDEEDKKIAKPWLDTPLDNEKVKKNANKITAIFSDNDPFVPLENSDYFKERLGAKTIIIKGKGHIGGSDNIKECPLILEELLKLIAGS